MKFKIPKEVITSFIEKNFGQIKNTSSGEIRINTPFANDNKFHMYINLDKGLVYDFKNNQGCSVLKFISQYLNVSEKEASLILIREYAGRSSSLFKEIKVADAIEKEIETPKGLEFFYEKSGGIVREKALSYLRGRKIPEENIQELGFIFDPDDTKYHQRIFVPFYEEEKLVYFITRDYTGKNPLRYSNPENVNSKKFVFNIDKIEDIVFIFEGVFDALMLDKQVGTAMLSADINKTQIIKIWNKAPKMIIFVPDNDKAGKKTLDKNINLLLRYKPPSLNTKVLIHEVLYYKDFSESGCNSINISECFEYNPKSLDRLLK
jgi:DNA primase